MSAGDWQELGFKDGSKGANIDRVHKYTNVCAEHGISVQSSLYSKGMNKVFRTIAHIGAGLTLGRMGRALIKPAQGLSIMSKPIQKVVWFMKSSGNMAIFWMNMKA